ncbi:hypothetical protein IJI69_00335 [Candidatus Saccharibacteria bacterium]|nr:hypothetical protein [Candidatus Saccharibacteria bacterium]MBQ6127136.1 hypothetical protein [Candidatus Saccharibacteria bacterium]
MKRKEAKAFIEAIKAIRSGADDKAASEATEIYPTLKGDGSLVPYQTRINWNGQLKRAAVDLWDTEENNPDNAPSLWLDINYIHGTRIIPETITAAEAFAQGEKGYWQGELYESLIPNNVWTPTAYPAGWQKIDEE